MTPIDKIKDYYGRVLQDQSDLKTTACCAVETIPEWMRTTLSDIHEEVRAKFYGCGAVFPPLLDGLHVLDLGSGSGRDSYMLSKFVGPTGTVTGVDMTGEQLATARKYLDYHRQKFAYQKSNVDFREGYIEDLESLGIGNESIDLVVSNCVINLSPDKERVFREIWRVLKPGGELYFSDVFCDRRLNTECQQDAVLLGECLGGAMYKEDFRRLMTSIGCLDFRVISQSPIVVTDPTLRSKLGSAQFTSITIRALKVPLEDRCEDYGQVGIYQGGIVGSENAFMLDDHHLFEKDRPMLICSNTANMLSESRFAPYFRVIGDTTKHFGLFDCAPATPSTSAPAGACC